MVGWVLPGGGLDRVHGLGGHGHHPLQHLWGRKLVVWGLGLEGRGMGDQGALGGGRELGGIAWGLGHDVDGAGNVLWGRWVLETRLV